MRISVSFQRSLPARAAEDRHNNRILPALGSADKTVARLAGISCFPSDKVVFRPQKSVRISEELRLAPLGGNLRHTRSDDFPYLGVSEGIFHDLGQINRRYVLSRTRKPVRINKSGVVAPIETAFLFMSSTNLYSEPATSSARATAASFAELISAAFSSSSTVTLSPSLNPPYEAEYVKRSC